MRLRGVLDHPGAGRRGGQQRRYGSGDPEVVDGYDGGRLGGQGAVEGPRLREQGVGVQVVERGTNLRTHSRGHNIVAGVGGQRRGVAPRCGAGEGECELERLGAAAAEDHTIGAEPLRQQAFELLRRIPRAAGEHGAERGGGVDGGVDGRKAS